MTEYQKREIVGTVVISGLVSGSVAISGIVATSGPITGTVATSGHITGTVAISDGTEIAAVNAAGRLEVAPYNATAANLMVGAYVATEDTGATYRYLKVDASNYLYMNLKTALPTGTNIIGSVKLTDGVSTASINANSILNTSPEHSLKGKTILYKSYGFDYNLQTMLTVSAGSTFYLLEAGILAQGSTNNTTAEIYIGDTTATILGVTINTVATYHPWDTNQGVVAFAQPIPISASVPIKCGGTGTTGKGWIVGWQE